MPVSLDSLMSWHRKGPCAVENSAERYKVVILTLEVQVTYLGFWCI